MDDQAEMGRERNSEKSHAGKTRTILAMKLRWGRGEGIDAEILTGSIHLYYKEGQD